VVVVLSAEFVEDTSRRRRIRGIIRTREPVPFRGRKGDGGNFTCKEGVTEPAVGVRLLYHFAETYL